MSKSIRLEHNCGSSAVSPAAITYRKYKKELVEFMGGKCAICGFVPPADSLGVLEIDAKERPPISERERRYHGHVRGATGNPMTRKRLKELKQEFLDGKTQLLCANCSRIKSQRSKDTAPHSFRIHA